MKRIIVLGTAITALVAATPAGAQTAGAFMANSAFRDPPPARCTSTVEMQRCAAHDLRVADAQMSARYAALHARLQPVGRRTLLEEQRIWLRSRDRDCLAKHGGGSMASLIVARCWVNMTEARSTVLGTRSSRGSKRLRALPAAAFLGRWRGGEGTYIKITRRGSGPAIDNQWGLNADMRGIFTGTITAAGLSFRRNGVTEIVRPGVGDAVRRSALVGKKDCLIVKPDEGYCRY